MIAFALQSSHGNKKMVFVRTWNNIGTQQNKVLNVLIYCLAHQEHSRNGNHYDWHVHHNHLLILSPSQLIG